jgi:putative spermidine/putrescine transport system ATP-binding protein
MSDRVAVFNAGRVEQLSTPHELYRRPRTAFVARFVGSANVIDAALAQQLSGRPQPFALRAEDVRLSAADANTPTGHHVVDAAVLDVQYHGANNRWLLQLSGDARLIATRPVAENTSLMTVGTRVKACWPTEAAVPLDA